MIWNAAEAGDETLLQQYLVGASAEDTKFEKRDKVRHRVEKPSTSAVNHRKPIASGMTWSGV
jgi:hypothetical protein